MLSHESHIRLCLFQTLKKDKMTNEISIHLAGETVNKPINKSISEQFQTVIKKRLCKKIKHSLIESGDVRMFQKRPI